MRGALFFTFCLLIPNPLLFASSPSTDKLQHPIFIIQENHSFDNYFGTYPSANGLGNVTVACCRTSTSSITSGIVESYHLDISQPVAITGDELSPNQMYPSDSNVVLPFLISNETSVTLLHS